MARRPASANDWSKRTSPPVRTVVPFAPRPSRAEVWSARYPSRSTPALARPRDRSVLPLADRAAQLSIVRVLLLVVAVQIIAFSLPALVLGDESNTSTHAARHLGAFTAAYGVALLVVAARPARARTMLPVAAVLAGALVITAIVDMVNGHIPLVGETQHIPELISVVLIWMMTVRSPEPQGEVRFRSAMASTRPCASSTTNAPPANAVHQTWGYTVL